MMQRQVFLTAAVAITNAARVLAQSPTTASSPLSNFIGAANSAAAAASSAAAVESLAAAAALSAAASTPSATTSAAPTATSSAAAAAAEPSTGLSNAARISIIVAAVVIALILLAVIAGCIYCCCVRRRRRDRKATRIPDEEVPEWHRPANPGRAYTPVSNHPPVPMSQQPTVSPTIPLMAHTERPAATEHHVYHHHENPFVPVPPQPRKPLPSSRAGVADGTAPGPAALVASSTRNPIAAMTRPRSDSKSRNSYTSYHSSINSVDALPTHYDADRPPTPFGLMGNPTTPRKVHGYEPVATGSNQPYSAIGAPYNDMHVHTLLTEQPSEALRQSLSQRPSPIQTSSYGNRRYSGHATPPMVPSRSPQRRSGFQDSTYDTGSGSTSSGGESWRSTQMHPTTTHARPSFAPWESSSEQRRYSGDRSYDGRARSRSAGRTSWRQGSPVQMQGQGGTPKRLRFSDVQAANAAGVGRAY